MTELLHGMNAYWVATLAGGSAWQACDPESTRVDPATGMTTSRSRRGAA